MQQMQDSIDTLSTSKTRDAGRPQQAGRGAAIVLRAARARCRASRPTPWRRCARRSPRSSRRKPSKSTRRRNFPPASRSWRKRAMRPARPLWLPLPRLPPSRLPRSLIAAAGFDCCPRLSPAPAPLTSAPLPSAPRPVLDRRGACADAISRAPFPSRRRSPCCPSAPNTERRRGPAPGWTGAGRHISLGPRPAGQRVRSPLEVHRRAQ